jgi:hypothetical protein
MKAFYEEQTIFKYFPTHEIYDFGRSMEQQEP